MFSQACVIPSVHGFGGGGLPRGGLHWGGGWFLHPGGSVYPGGSASGGSASKGEGGMHPGRGVCIQGRRWYASRKGGPHPGRGVYIQEGRSASRRGLGRPANWILGVQEVCRTEGCKGGCVQEVHTPRPRGRHPPSGPRGRTPHPLPYPVN